MQLLSDQVTKHFRLDEFACLGSMIVTPEYIRFVTDVLEPFRVWYNRPIEINSGFRTVSHNQEVGGAVNSLHLRAMAVDTDLPAFFFKAGKDRQKEFFLNIRKKWVSLCAAAGGYAEICLYDTFVHLGMRWDAEKIVDKRKVREWMI